MLILGLNAFHADAAACVVKDGKLVAAVEEERFRRVKHWAGFPTEAISWCLSEVGARLSDIDHVALNQDSRANLWKRAEFLVKSRPNVSMILDRVRARKNRVGVDRLLEELFLGETLKGRVHGIEHHLAHLSSAFFVSPFNEAVAVSVDGFGDFASAAWGIGHGTEIDVLGRVGFPHSLGILYQAVTQYLGFLNYGDEYKVMGLAPYGQPVYLDKLRQLIRLEENGGFELNTSFFRHEKEHIPHQWDNGSPSFGDLFSPALEDLLGPRRHKDDPLEQRHRDLARSIQSVYEGAFFNLIRAAREGTDIRNIVLAGGCANNSVANGKIRRETAFEHVYVHAAPGDQGGAIGAAFALWHRLGGSRSFVMDHAYWGPSFDDATCASVLDRKQGELQAQNCSFRRVVDEADLCRIAASAVADGKVVGWFQGRMEWGPRALGNRSIVCDPRRPDMKHILNAKIKRREGFRPFAPSILDEHVSSWFEEDDAVPFMMQVFQIRAEKRQLIPAVTHVDGSGRLQTVYRKTNPRYARLIESFNALTGIPMVLNTSFNENEPVVCRPEEALDCFLRTKMDLLILENFVIEREE